MKVFACVLLAVAHSTQYGVVVGPPLIPDHVRANAPIELRYPTQRDGAYFLDDLRTIPVMAIVRPVGAPRVESRAQKCGIDSQPTFPVSVQRVQTVVAEGALSESFDVVAPIYLKMMEPFNGFFPLEDGNYLLLGAKSENAQLKMALNLFGDSNSRPTEKNTHFVAASATDVAGWSLVRTDAKTLPEAPSREESVLQAVLQACEVSKPKPAFSAVYLMGGIFPGPRTLRTTPKPANEPPDRFNYLVGKTPVDRYYSNVIRPRLWELALKQPKIDQIPILNALSRLNDGEAKAKLEESRREIPPR